MPTAWINFPTPTCPSTDVPLGSGQTYDNYTQAVVVQAARRVLQPAGWELVEGFAGQSEKEYDAYVADYDTIPFERLLRAERGTCSSYVIRKALIRKHHLAHALRLDAAKRSERSERLRACTPCTWDFELQFSDDLDELLMDDLYDLNEALTQPQSASSSQSSAWFILKPGMADRGRGIRLFNSLDTLRDIFEQFEREDLADEENESDEEDGKGAQETREDDSEEDQDGDGGMLGQLRHFVIQEYLSKPLLLSPGNATEPGRKFHLRAYVLCVGAMQVYLWDEMLALFAPIGYAAPQPDALGHVDLDAHLTNTCRQSEMNENGGRPKEENVHLWSDLVGTSTASTSTDGSARVLTPEDVDMVRARVAETVGLVFSAAAHAGSVHLQLWPNAWEVFGVDLLVDDSLNVKLLEVNAQPDFAQTGARLVGTIEQLFERTLQVALLGQSAPWPTHELEPQSGDTPSPWPLNESREGMRLCLNEPLLNPGR